VKLKAIQTKLFNQFLKWKRDKAKEEVKRYTTTSEDQYIKSLQKAFLFPIKRKHLGAQVGEALFSSSKGVEIVFEGIKRQDKAIQTKWIK